MAAQFDRTVMIVDDVPAIRIILRKMLETSGYTVVAEAADGIEAVTRYNEMHPYITLMDISLPCKNGIDATKDILSLNREAKVVMISALPDDAIDRAAQASGARDYICKPFTINSIENVLRRVMYS